MSKLRVGERLPGFTDVRFSPLYTAALGRTIVQIADAKLTGLYHVGAADGMSKFEFARAVATVFGYDPELVQPTTSTNAGWTAPRPRDTTLISVRLARALGRQAPSIEDGLLELKAQVATATAPGDEESP